MPCISIASPIRAKTPATMPTTPPRTSEEIFSVTSVFASSISSRTRVEYARRHLNATLLPDGKILVSGGTSGAGFNNPSTPVMAAEMWNPVTETWTTMASGTIPRLYHSGALLLPDGRVFATGGDGYNQAEVYSPPYLFRGARPAIAAAPASVAYGQTFFVETPNAASITQVTWVGLSSVTHAFNMNQRINVLSFSQAAGGLNVVAPSSPTLAPIGHYMLFILNSDGVPSVAKIIRLNNGSGPAGQFFDALYCGDRWSGIFSDSRGQQLRRRLDRSMERRESEHHVLKQQPAHRHDSRKRYRCRWDGTGPGDESRSGAFSNAMPFTILRSSSLTLSATSVPAGTPVTVTLNNGKGGSTDWLALAAVGASDSSYLQWTYVGGGSRHANLDGDSAWSGSYEFRLFLNDSYIRAATSPAVTVTQVVPTLSVSATSVDSGIPVTVTLNNGSGGSY